MYIFIFRECNRFVHLSPWMKIDDLVSGPRKGASVSGVLLWSVGAGSKRTASLLPKYADNNELACKWRQRGSGGGVERGGWLLLFLLSTAPGSALEPLQRSPNHTLYPAECFLHQTNSYKCLRTGTSNDSYFISAASWQMTMQLGWIRFLFINLDAGLSTRIFSLSISTNTFKVQHYFRNYFACDEILLFWSHRVLLKITHTAKNNLKVMLIFASNFFLDQIYIICHVSVMFWR